MAGVIVRDRKQKHGDPHRHGMACGHRSREGSCEAKSCEARSCRLAGRSQERSKECILPWDFRSVSLASLSEETFGHRNYQLIWPQAWLCSVKGLENQQASVIVQPLLYKAWGPKNAESRAMEPDFLRQALRVRYTSCV